MAFRDDEEARRQRIESLEKELASARTEHGRAAAAEREQEEQRDELAKRVEELEAKLREAKREPEPERAPPTPKPPGPPAPSPGVLRRAWGAALAGFWPVVTVLGCVSFGYCTVQDCRPGCKAADDHIEVDLPGEVSEASGVNMPVGTRCRVRALFFANRDDNLYLWESEVGISCGGRTVFEADANNACAVGQTRQGRGWAYTVPGCTWSDDEMTVMWSGESITLSSSAPVWSYTIRVPSPMESAAALYDPVLVDSRFSEPKQANAEVIVISGASPVLPGASCAIDVQPTQANDPDDNCSISVRCEQRVLRSARGRCEVRHGEVVSATGPGVTVDFGTGLVRVQESEGPGVPYLASLRITPE